MQLACCAGPTARRPCTGALAVVAGRGRQGMSHRSLLHRVRRTSSAACPSHHSSTGATLAANWRARRPFPRSLVGMEAPLPGPARSSLSCRRRLASPELRGDWHGPPPRAAVDHRARRRGGASARSVEADSAGAILACCRRARAVPRRRCRLLRRSPTSVDMMHPVARARRAHPPRRCARRRPAGDARGGHHRRHPPALAPESERAIESERRGG
eukprot:scaffold673_cov410-Prasinococcus_capsulatus_cf.AAC.15